MLTSINNTVPKSPNRRTGPSFCSLKQEKFNRIFPVFLANTDEKTSMVKQMKPMLQKIKTDWNKKLKILDAGCGDGLTSEKIFKKMRAIIPKFRAVVLAADNNPGQLSDYVHRIDQKKNIEVLPSKADVFSPQFLESPGIQDIFDITMASHSLYHASTDSVEKTIERLDKTTSKNGMIFISLLEDDSDFSRLQDKFGQFVTSDNETNQVKVKLSDITKAINTKKMEPRTLQQPYKAYVYLPRQRKHFQEFKDWQLNNHKSPAPSKQSQKIMDLLEFTLHGDLQKLRQNNQLKSFLTEVESIINKNGTKGFGKKGRPKINYNGRNIFILKDEAKNNA